MPLIGYKKEFAHLVETGEKRQTIRAIRKRPFKAGETLYHYTGLRTKACRKLLESTCSSVQTVYLDTNGDLCLDGKALPSSARQDFAWADGFRDYGDKWHQFYMFFYSNHGLPFHGQLIKW